MNSEQFTYWLNGFFELSGAKELNEQQVKIIKDHIALVIKKVTPQVDPLMPPFNPYNIGPYIPPSITSDKIYIPANPIPKQEKFEVTCELPKTGDYTTMKFNGVDIPVILTGDLNSGGTLNI